MLSLLADGYKSWRESKVRLVEFRALNIICMLVSLRVSLACLISSDVLIHAQGSEESLSLSLLCARVLSLSLSLSLSFYLSLCSRLNSKARKLI